LLETFFYRVCYYPPSCRLNVIGLYAIVFYDFCIFAVLLDVTISVLVQYILHPQGGSKSKPTCLLLNQIVLLLSNGKYPVVPYTHWHKLGWVSITCCSLHYYRAMLCCRKMPVCLSVKRRYCVEMAKHHQTLFTIG